METFFVKLEKKIKEKKGESLTETLVALLIMCMAMTVISGSVIAAARINRKADDIEVSTMLKAGDERVTSNADAKLPTNKTRQTVTFSEIGIGGIGSSKSVNVDFYTEPAGGANFKFYELPAND